MAQQARILAGVKPPSDATDNPGTLSKYNDQRRANAAGVLVPQRRRTRDLGERPREESHGGSVIDRHLLRLNATTSRFALLANLVRFWPPSISPVVPLIRLSMLKEGVAR